MAHSTLYAVLLAVGTIASPLTPTAPAFAQDAAVRVAFVQPERYTDAQDHGARATAATLKALETHLQQLGARYLKPGQSLDIQVLDVDLAGRFEPWRPLAYDVRIMRAITWPRIDLRYTLTQNGAAVAQGEESVKDLNYQTHVGATLSDDRLRYEKAMLDDWFKAQFAPHQTPAS